MQYTVRISDTVYEVEIEDLETRPIIARVNGEPFEVHPEDESPVKPSTESDEFRIAEPPQPVAIQSVDFRELTAPLPGTIVEIFVRKGEEIEAGHVVLIIEAMKMKNSIRSTRAGRIAEVLVSVGQTVAHKQALVRFE